MNLDIRTPIALLFFILGLIITGCGLILPPETYVKSLGININLIWGLTLIGFSGLMHLWSWLERPRQEREGSEDGKDHFLKKEAYIPQTE